MGTFGVMVKKEWAELIGTKKLLIVGVLFLFVALISPITAKLLPQLFQGFSQQGISITMVEPTFKDAIDQFVKNISQLLAFVLIFVVAGALADEKTRKTLEIVLTKPVRRSTFVLAKIASYLAAVTLMYALSVAVFYSYTISLFGEFDASNFLALALLLLIFLLLMVITLIFASAIANTSLVASGIGFLFYVFYLGIWALFKKIADYSPGYIISHYQEVVKNGWDSSFWPSIATSIGFMIVLTLLAVYSFKRQEIER